MEKFRWDKGDTASLPNTGIQILMQQLSAVRNKPLQRPGVSHTVLQSGLAPLLCPLRLLLGRAWQFLELSTGPSLFSSTGPSDLSPLMEIFQQNKQPAVLSEPLGPSFGSHLWLPLPCAIQGHVCLLLS